MEGRQNRKPRVPYPKLCTTLGKFGEFVAHIPYFWLAWVGHYHLVNRKFSKLSKGAADPTYLWSIMILRLQF